MGLFSSIGKVFKKVVGPAIGYVSGNPWLGTLGSTALSLAGGERGNILRRQMQTRQMAFEGASARQMMQFQREMANTAHQRQVKDLRAAGLNPILSSRYGGAATPPGAMARGSLPQMQDPFSTAAQIRINERQLGLNERRLNEDVNLIRATVGKTLAERQRTIAETSFRKQETFNAVQRAGEIVANTGLKRQQILESMVRIGLIKAQMAQQLQAAKTAAAQEQVFWANSNVAKAQLDHVKAEVEILNNRIPRTNTEATWASSLLGKILIFFGQSMSELTKIIPVLVRVTQSSGR